MSHEELLKPEEVEFYRKTVTYEVEDLMKRVAKQNDVFADYQVLLSGSTRENVRVGDPYEIDYLIQYDIKVNKIIEVPSYLGYVWVFPKEEDSLRLQSVMKQNILSSNKLMFQFFKIVNDIINEPEYETKEFYFYSGVRFYNPKGGAFFVNELNFRTLSNIGAAMPVHVRSNNNEIKFGSKGAHETIDIVLSLHCHGYWPQCADGWKRYKEVLNRECYDAILEHGVSLVCKVPVKDTRIFNDKADVFRLSFSFAESKLLEFVTPEQRDAFKILKALRDEHFPERPRSFNIHEKCLRDRFSSYHLKSIFLTLTIGNYEKNDVRGWLVLLLKEIIICLQKQSIKHHFIDDLELLVYPSEKEDFKLQEGNYKHYSHEYSGENKIFPSQLKKDCKDLESIFAEILEKLPADLSKLREKCLLKATFYCIGPSKNVATALTQDSNKKLQNVTLLKVPAYGLI